MTLLAKEMLHLYDSDRASHLKARMRCEVRALMLPTRKLFSQVRTREQENNKQFIALVHASIKKRGTSDLLTFLKHIVFQL